ncbi:MAG: class A beta-lactamase-related serine hydrolase [Halomonadaceae bacterium]|nr:MAG: class A beta-lactamase-related serine hydrolase [Halomonadaceae bacterium]
MNTIFRKVLRSSRIPADLAPVTGVDYLSEVDPALAGLSQGAIDAMWQATQGLYRTGTHPGIQLCVRRKGHIVMNRTLGHSQGNGPEDRADGPRIAMSTQTPVCYFSASKAVTALLVHMLADEGALNLLDPVSFYCPEFGKKGKERITLHQILSHRGGIPGLPVGTPLDFLWDEQKIWRMLCDAEPIAVDGAKLAYHAITGGYVLGEVVRRVTGKSIEVLLDERIRQPMAMDYFTYGIDHEKLPELAWNYATGPKLHPPLTWVVKRALGADVDTVAEISNDPRFQEAVIPAGNLVGTAEEMSRFYQMMLDGGLYQGKRICSERCVQRAVQPFGAMQVDRTLMIPMQFSAGFMLGADPVGLWGLNSASGFGHIGLINKWCWADPSRDISVSLINTGIPIVGHHLPALMRFVHTVNSACPILPSADQRLLAS